MTAARLLAALLLGVPAGFLGDVVQQAFGHPAFRWLLLHQPLLALPPLGLPAAFAGAGVLSGIGVPGGAAVLRGWMVACAVTVFVWSEHRAG